MVLTLHGRDAYKIAEKMLGIDFRMLLYATERDRLQHHIVKVMTQQCLRMLTSISADRMQHLLLCAATTPQR